MIAEAKAGSAASIPGQHARISSPSRSPITEPIRKRARLNPSRFFASPMAIAEWKSRECHFVQVTTSRSITPSMACLPCWRRDQGRSQRRHQIARDRIRQARHSRDAVAPGVIKTPMHPPRRMRRSARCTRRPHGRDQGHVDAILYLAGAGFVTGEICTSTAARAPAIEPPIRSEGSALADSRSRRTMMLL